MHFLHKRPPSPPPPEDLHSKLAGPGRQGESGTKQPADQAAPPGGGRAPAAAPKARPGGGGAAAGAVPQASELQRRLERAALDELREVPPPPTRRKVSPGSLPRLSRSELCAQLEAQATDLSELGQLLSPLKVENVRLARMLKNAVMLLQEVAESLSKFFTDPSRREWFKTQKDENPGLVAFFKTLVGWYRKVCDFEEDSTLSFYQKLWQYERGGEDQGGQAKDQGSSHSVFAPAPRMSRSTSSSVLYDACQARADNVLLQGENTRLLEQNLGLRRTVTALEEWIKGLSGSDTGTPMPPAAPPSPTRGQRPRAPPAPAAEAPGGAPRRRQGARTLAQLALEDPRWSRLLHDRDGLFGPDDVVDETYEQYLKDVLDLMERHGCTFKRAIELSEAGAGAGGPSGPGPPAAGAAARGAG